MENKSGEQIIYIKNAIKNFYNKTMQSHSKKLLTYILYYKNNLFFSIMIRKIMYHQYFSLMYHSICI